MRECTVCWTKHVGLYRCSFHVHVMLWTVLHFQPARKFPGSHKEVDMLLHPYGQFLRKQAPTRYRFYRYQSDASQSTGMTVNSTCTIKQLHKLHLQFNRLQQLYNCNIVRRHTFQFKDEQNLPKPGRQRLSTGTSQTHICPCHHNHPFLHWVPWVLSSLATYVFRKKWLLSTNAIPTPKTNISQFMFICCIVAKNICLCQSPCAMVHAIDISFFRQIVEHYHMHKYTKWAIHPGASAISLVTKWRRL